MSGAVTAGALLAIARVADEAALVQALAASEGAVVRAALTPDGTQEGLLQIVAARNFGGAAKKLLALAPPLDAPDAEGLTALHVAIMAGHAEMVRLLLKSGADPAVRVLQGVAVQQNAFHLAARQSPPLMSALLAHGDLGGLYDTVILDGLNVDALRIVLRSERTDLLDVMIAGGVALNRRGADNATAAQFVMLHRTSRQGGLAVLQMLEAHGADLVRGRTNGGESFLMLAAREGWYEAFDYLLALGVPVDVRAADGTTLLHAAAKGPHVAVLQKTLTLGLDVNVRQRDGATPLHVAAHRNRTRNVELLLEAGADPHIADRQGRTPDMVCQARVQAVTRAVVLRAQRSRKPSRLPPRFARKPPPRVTKKRFGPSNGR